MQTIFIAAGDSLHGDAAVAHRVLELLGSQPNVYMHDVPRLTTRLAEEIAPAANVVFIDADRELGEPWVEAAPPAGLPASSDTAKPTEIVALAEKLFHFRGNAYVCHVPGLDFRARPSLTSYAESRARQAAALLRRFLRDDPAVA